MEPKGMSVAQIVRLVIGLVLVIGSGSVPGTRAAASGPTVIDFDFNGDGNADILWRHRTSGATYLWLMNGLSVAAQGALPGVSGWSPVVFYFEFI